MGSTVIITGGTSPNEKLVSEYNEAGFIKYLPPLRQGRYNHGCSYYENDDGTKVIWILITLYSHFSSDTSCRWWPRIFH